MQMRRYGCSILKLDSIFITHIHGDHLFGLFGLLSTMGMLGRTAPLNIYAPANFSPILKFFLSYFGEGLAFELRHEPVRAKEPEVIYSTKTLEVLAFPLNHKIETFGYLFREKEPQRNIDKDALEKYGFTRMEIGTLKRGEDVLRPQGQDEGATFLNGFVRHSGTDEPLLIKASEVTYRPFRPRSYAYISDTAPFPELSGWVRGADIIYHEATYLEALSDQARLRHHSTALDAARLAADAGARRLILGHYSSRASDPDLFQEEARRIFPETYAAREGDLFEIPLEK